MVPQRAFRAGRTGHVAGISSDGRKRVPDARMMPVQWRETREGLLLKHCRTNRSRSIPKHPLWPPAAGTAAGAFFSSCMLGRLFRPAVRMLLRSIRAKKSATP